MHIVVIAWLYVAFMMAITETSAVAGIMSFLFYGLLPAGIVFYLGNSTRRRRQRNARRAQTEQERQKEEEKKG